MKTIFMFTSDQVNQLPHLLLVSGL